MTEAGARRGGRSERGRELVRLGVRRLRGGELTPLRGATSVALGLAIGMTPLYGLHFVLVLALCLPLKLDAAVAYVASNVSLPFIAPLLLTAEVATGALVLGEPFSFSRLHALEPEALLALGRELTVGTAVLAPLAAALAFAVTYLLLSRRRARAALLSRPRPGT